MCRELILGLALTSAAAAQTLTRPPELVRPSEPAWPFAPGDPLAPDAPVVVELLITIEADGAVGDVVLQSPPHPGFDGPAVVAARGLRFRPAELDGAPAAVRVRYRYTFLPPPPAPEPAPEPAPAPEPVIDDAAVVVRGRRPRQPPAAARLEVVEARRATGSMGDALAAAKDAPGVARPTLGSGGLAVWGAAPAETAVLVDDVPIPRLYHLGGLRSVIHDGAVRRVELEPAAFAAPYGRVVGGVLRVVTREPDRTGGEASADVLDGAALVGVGGEGAAAEVGGRYGYAGETVGALAPEVEDLVPLSAWRSYLGGGRLGRTRLLAFGATDDVERALPGVDATGTERTRAAFHRVALRREGSGGFAVLWAGVDTESTEARFGPLPAEVERNDVRAGARGDLRLELGPHRLRLGLDAEVARGEHRRAGTLALPPREGDAAVFGQAPGDRVNADRWTTTFVAAGAYAHGELALLGDALLVSPGLRLEPVALGGDAVVPAPPGGVPTGYDRFELWVEPRLAAELRLPGELSVRAAGGRYHQAPDGADRSAVFGGTDLGAAESWHGVLGVAWRATWLEAELVGFSRRTEGLAARSPEAHPPVAGALVDAGEARSLGGQLALAARPLSDLVARLGYVLSRAERRDPGAAQWRPFSHDRTHDLLLQLGWTPGAWVLGSRLRYTTGAPRTAVSGAWYDAGVGRHQPVLGEANGARLGDWVQLDLSVGHTWVLEPLELTASLEVLNVTNRANEEAAVYRFDYGERGALTGLPTTAVAGLRVSL